ncbi:nuclear transport factor 2 family protein [Rhizobium terrae]|uniref:nuclear transport factor 2 family protein n=1 Tax=Rhizobium terrae TaxID=2171756 RepID=UPI000E3D297F|nr:nuclear transport factor 2 family protein [Rhizobium terrae]
MNALAELTAKAEILSLVTEYWNEVDTNWGTHAHMMFTEDGVFGSGPSAFVGREQIKAFYDWRRGRGDRVARHLVNNPMILIEGADRATIKYIMTIYAIDGLPVLPVSAPNSISEVVEVLARDGTGGWKIRSKTFTHLFKGEEPTTTMPEHLRNTLLSKVTRPDQS